MSSQGHSLESKAMLNSEACMTQSWATFRRQAEKAAWIAFPEKIICAAEVDMIDSKQKEKFQSLPKSKGKEKFCILHGKAGHFTRECEKVREMEIQKVTIKEIRAKIQACELEDNAFNKKDLIYIDRNEISGHRKNPFFIEIAFNNKKCNALIDTGVDLSIASRNLLPEIKYDSCVGVKLRSVCGGNLKVVGRKTIINVKCEEIGSDLKLDIILIDEGPLNYIILGADAIKNNLCLVDIIKRRSISENKVNRIRVVEKKV
jgi:Retroviral aspartyl protease